MNIKYYYTKKTLVGLIGIDYRLLQETGKKTQLRFVWAARFVALILLLSFVSVYYAFELMFHNWFAQVMLSLFFSLMFATIYVLLIQTFSKQPLGDQGRMFGLNISNASRGAFILFIGFLIAKPIEILVLAKYVGKDIITYKENLKRKFAKTTDLVYSSDLAKLQRNLTFFKSMGTTIPKKELMEIQDRIDAIHEKMKAIVNATNQSIDNSDFFLKRIELSTQNYLISWFFCALIIFLFATPVIVIYTISSSSEYYQLKRDKDVSLVVNQYNQFLLAYSQTFEKTFQLMDIQFYEIHSDAPFRTMRVSPPVYSSQEEFLKPFIGNGL